MKKEQWMEYRKRADFAQWSKELHISPVTARVIRNRDIETLEEARVYLYGTMEDLCPPEKMKDLDLAARILLEHIKSGYCIAIAGDYDSDGIFSSRVLQEGIQNLGGKSIIYTPDRVLEGYGLNRRIVDQAKAEGCQVLLTCDNGIVAFEEVEYANAQGFTVIITDHHEVQYVETDGKKEYLLPKASAVVNPKQADDAYPCKYLCGAGVAFRLIQRMYALRGIPKEKEEELYEYVAIATVADVMELRDENRILVREGLKRLRNTKKPGLKALIQATGIAEPNHISAYHIGFILGPCFNSAGRLAHADLAHELLSAKTEEEAMPIAVQLKELNDSRKGMTEEGVKQAIETVEQAEWKEDLIYLLVVEDCHESLAGIIAGRLKEKYGRPVFVFTRTKEGLKGSGRSVAAYHMLEGLLKAKDLLDRFGGHAMAAGLSLAEENLPALRAQLNTQSGLTMEDLVKVVHFDAQVPLNYWTENNVEELDLLEPYGMGNPRPLFVRGHFRILQLRIIGKNQNVLKLVLQDDSMERREGVLFGQVEEFREFLISQFGEDEWKRCSTGQDNHIDVAFTYYPDINEYQGRKTIQVVLQSYCRI